VRSHVRGIIEFEGRRIERLDPADIVDAGIALVPEGRRLFARMTVQDNLLAGAYLPRCRPGIDGRLREVYELFPRLGERREQVVSQMSGGEQQMVAIGRALMSSPRLLLFDELSLGLAPAMVDEIYRNLTRIIASGVTTGDARRAGPAARAGCACNRFCRDAGRQHRARRAPGRGLRGRDHRRLLRRPPGGRAWTPLTCTGSASTWPTGCCRARCWVATTRW
jgi:hypothetical protein